MSCFLVCQLIWDYKLGILNIQYYEILGSVKILWRMLIFVCVFLFHSQLTHLDLGNNSHYTFCGLLFQCQFSFQRFCSTVLILLTCVPPMDQSGTWAMAYIVVCFSKPLELYFNSFSWMHSWGICSGLHTQLHQIFSSHFLLFVISLKLPGS